MNWLAWIVLAVLAAATVIWLVRRFRTENSRIEIVVHRPADTRPAAAAVALVVAGLVDA